MFSFFESIDCYLVLILVLVDDVGLPTMTCVEDIIELVVLVLTYENMFLLAAEVESPKACFRCKAAFFDWTEGISSPFVLFLWFCECRLS